MVQGTVIESKREAFPTGQAKRYSALLNVVNTELKCATVYYLGESPFAQTSAEIQARHKGIFGFYNEWVPTHASFGNLCHHTLYPIGCVAEEKVEREKDGREVKSWKLTKEGAKYGLPVARFALRKAVDFGVSMFQVLGATQSSGETRAPHARAKILEELYEKDFLRTEDLRKCGGGTQSHLPSLREAGAIEYEAINPEESGWAKKQWSGDINNLPRIGMYSKSTVRSVAEVLAQGDKDCNEVHEDLASRGVSLAPNTIKCIISGLEAKGFIQSPGFKGREILSKASLNFFGKRYVDEFLSPVRRYLSDKKVPEIAECEIDSQVIRSAVKLYEPLSGRDKFSQEEHLALLEELCRSSPLGIRPVEFAEKSGMGKASSEDVLSKLHRQGKVIKTKQGKAVYYRPKWRDEE